MPIVNALSKAVVRDFTLQELEQAARLMRGYDLVALCAAGSGHAGGTLSMMEIVAALYLKVANHDPNLPDWRDRDRIVWSAGHKAPALYLGLGFAGYFPHRGCRHPAQAVFAVPGPSASAEAARGRGVQRIARAGTQHRGGHGAGWKDEATGPHRVLHHG